MIDRADSTLSDARLDRVVKEVLAERADDIYASVLPAHDVTARMAGRPRQGWLREAIPFGDTRGLAILAVAALLALAAAALLVVGSWLRPFDSQLAVAERIVDAVNAREPDALQSLMTRDGVLEFPAIDTRVDGEGTVYMTYRAVSETQYGWLEILEMYWGGMHAELGSCRSLAPAAISCDVRTRWRTLLVEIGEEWRFQFDGARVSRLEMFRIDPDPPDRLMPLALADLAAWEAWLQVAHPEQAESLMFDDDGLFEHLYFRYAWARPEEIGASIREYLATGP